MNSISNTSTTRCFLVVIVAVLASLSTIVQAQLSFTPSAGKTYKVGYCNICGGDGYLLSPNQSFSNGSRQWTCGYAQTTVQDVSVTRSDAEKIHCQSTAMIAQEGGCSCSGGVRVQDFIHSPGEECDLCGRNQPIAHPTVLVNTQVAGSHQCGSLASFLQGGFSSNLCASIKVNSYSTCCVNNVLPTPVQNNNNVLPTPVQNNNVLPTPVQKKKCRSDTKKVIYVKPSNGKSKKCGWIKKGNSLKTRKKRCKMVLYNGKTIRHYCPRACGKYAGVGKCKDRWLADYK